MQPKHAVWALYRDGMDHKRLPNPDSAWMQAQEYLDRCLTTKKADSTLSLRCLFQCFITLRIFYSIYKIFIMNKDGFHSTRENNNNNREEFPVYIFSRGKNGDLCKGTNYI